MVRHTVQLGNTRPENSSVRRCYLYTPWLRAMAMLFAFIYSEGLFEFTPFTTCRIAMEK